MDYSNILVEPGIATYILKHVLIATTVSTVLHDNHAVVEIMNISLTIITIYGGTKSGEFIPQVNRITACRITTAVTLPTNLSTSLPTLNIDFTHHSTSSPHQQKDLLTLLAT